MKKSISVFQSHEEAVRALEALKESGLDMNKVSLIGRAEVIDDQIHVKSNNGIIAAPVVAGTVLGTTFGVLTGIGVLAIPGFGVLFGAGAIVGALAGFEVGVATGGLTSMLVGLGVKENHVSFEEHVKEGNFLLMIDGTEDEISRAEMIVQGKHLGIPLH